MRKYIGLAVVFALVVSVVPALAGESFHALSQLPAQAALTPLPDAQLATIEGTGEDVDVCIACFNISTVTQTNVAVHSKDVTQVNAAVVDQQVEVR